MLKWLAKFKNLWAFLMLFALVGIGFFAFHSFAKYNNKQWNIQQSKGTAKSKHDALIQQHTSHLQRAVFMHPDKFQTPQYQNGIKHKFSYGANGIEASVIQPVKILDAHNHVIKINPDSWFVTSSVTYKSGLVEYHGRHNQKAFSWGPGFVQRDYTVAELKKLCPNLKTAKLDTANQLKLEHVSTQTGPYVMTKAVAYGKQAPNKKNQVQASPGGVVSVAGFVTIKGRTFVITPQNMYVEAQRMFLVQHSNLPN